MKIILIPLFSLGMLVGCSSSHEDLQQFVNEVKARKVPVTESVPVIEPFHHLTYSSVSMRNPFSTPRPEALVVADDAKAKDCPQPDSGRKKQLLEKFSLDNLEMRGTLGAESQLWALIESQDGDLHKVGVGHYLGLHNGKVTRVSRDHVEILESVPDGRGCWIERTTQLMLAEAR